MSNSSLIPHHSSHPDVVVIGGGIIGAACGYYLAREGLSVHLLERSSLASGTSGACEGNILLWDKELTKELPLGQLSLRLWHELAADLEDDFEFDEKGGLMVADNEESLVAARHKVQDLKAAGIQGRMLDPYELREEEPLLARDLGGAALFPGDVQVEPRKATMALAAGGHCHGLVIREHTPVQRIVLGASGRVEAVETPAGRIETAAVVVAAGVWTREIAATAGLDVPVLPRKGHIVVTERGPLTVRRKLMEAGYNSTVASGDAGLQIAMVAESTHSGNLLLGSSRELVGIDRTVNPIAVKGIMDRAVRFFPALAGVQFIRTYAGLRPFSPDHLPMIGPVAGTEGFYVATGHEGAGIGLAPGTGHLIAQWVTGKPLDLPANWFSPERFRPEKQDGQD